MTSVVRPSAASTGSPLTKFENAFMGASWHRLPEPAFRSVRRGAFTLTAMTERSGPWGSRGKVKTAEHRVAMTPDRSRDSE